MNFDPHRILVISPHTDDAEVSSGGTISRFLREKREVYVLVLSRAFAEDTVLPLEECHQAMKVLGVPELQVLYYDFPVRRFLEHRQEILDIFIDIQKKIDPDLILLPSMNDIHQDHQVISREGLRAFKHRTILGYEYPWNHLVFNTTCFIKLDGLDIDHKIKAIQEYKSQVKDYMQPIVVEAWAITRGVAIQTRYAESFEVMRLVI